DHAPGLDLHAGSGRARHGVRVDRYGGRVVLVNRDADADRADGIAAQRRAAGHGVQVQARVTVGLDQVAVDRVAAVIDRDRAGLRQIGRRNAAHAVVADARTARADRAAGRDAIVPGARDGVVPDVHAVAT